MWLRSGDIGGLVGGRRPKSFAFGASGSGSVRKAEKAKVFGWREEC